MLEPKNRNDWGIYLAGKVIKDFIDENKITNDDELDDFIYNREEEMYEIFRSACWNYYSELNEED